MTNDQRPTTNDSKTSRPGRCARALCGIINMKKKLGILSLIIIGLVSYSQNDSIISESKLFVIQPIDSNKYYKASSNDTKRCLRYDFNWGKGEFIELSYLHPNNPNAYRIHDTLFLKLTNNSFKQLITSYPPNTDIEFTEYQYIDFIEDLGLYIIKGNYYEFTDLIVMTSNSGKLTYLPLEIAIYPSENILIGVQYDLIIGYYGNECDYYKIDKGELLKLWGITSENIGFSNPILTKHGEILFKKKEIFGNYDCCKNTYSRLLVIN
jgi:hypothetical protein